MIFKLMMLNEGVIILKNQISFNSILKHCITISFGQIAITLNQFFHLSRAKEYLKIFMLI